MKSWDDLSGRGRKSYEETTAWRIRQELLPPAMRIDSPPREEWLDVGRFRVHLDVHGPADAPATLVILHGGGGNGRLLAHYGQVAAAAGFRAVAPDLPGYGLSMARPRRSITYEDWRAVAAAVVEHAASSGRPVLVLGLSMGGMVAYDAAARTGVPFMVIATCLLDARRPEVQRQLVRWPWLAPVNRAMFALRVASDRLPIPMGWTSRMSGISNDRALTKSIARDRLAGGTWMPGRWVRTYMNAAPAIHPRDFDVCPVVLAHPAEDRWTSPELSEAFLAGLHRVPTRLVMLEGAGHFPIEDPGRSQLDELLTASLHEVADPSGQVRAP